MRAAAPFILALALAGCDPQSDMGQQPKYKPMSPDPTVANGASARPLVAGVVPRDPQTVPGNAYLPNAGLTPAGTHDTVDESATVPTAIDAALILRGQTQFEVFCAACHGRLGNGLGMVAQRGLMHPPSFHIDRLKNVGDGHFYNVISAGYGAMYSYADKIAPKDRWAVVAYVRALQAGGESADEKFKTVLIGAGDAKQKTAGYRQ